MKKAKKAAKKTAPRKAAPFKAPKGLARGRSGSPVRGAIPTRGDPDNDGD